MGLEKVNLILLMLNLSSQENPRKMLMDMYMLMDLSQKLTLVRSLRGESLLGILLELPMKKSKGNRIEYRERSVGVLVQ